MRCVLCYNVLLVLYAYNLGFWYIYVCVCVHCFAVFELVW
jgi:hypothetical protein